MFLFGMIITHFSFLSLRITLDVGTCLNFMLKNTLHCPSLYDAMVNHGSLLLRIPLLWTLDLACCPSSCNEDKFIVAFIRAVHKESSRDGIFHQQAYRD